MDGSPLRRFPRRLPTAWIDAVVALAVGLTAVVAITVAEEPSTRSPDAGAFALGLGIGALLTVRRRWPLGVLVASVSTLMLYHVLDYPAIGIVPLLAVALYTAAAAGHLRWSVVLGALPLIGSFAWRVLADGEAPLAVLNSGVQETAMVAAALLLGEAVRNRRAWMAEVQERLRRAEDEREQEAQRRVAQERLRIARELHDVMAHTVTVISVQAGVARDVLGEAPDQARAALTTIRNASREAMTELKATTGMWRELDGEHSGAPLAPQPGLADIDGLISMAATAGLRVETTVEGHPRWLPAAVDLTAFRIIQESLTNVLRHAQATTTEVRLRYEPGALNVTVIDDGRGASHGVAGSAGNPAAHVGQGEAHRLHVFGGHGLLGMTERVNALGGVLDAGPVPGGGFRVEARLPTRRLAS